MLMVGSSSSRTKARRLGCLIVMGERMGKQVKKADFIEVFIIFSTILVGLFHEFLACAAGITLCIYLLILGIKQRKIIFYTNITSISVFAIVLFYGLSAFWAVDSGDALIGFFKFLPLALITVLAMQRGEDSENFLRYIPITASFMTVVSAILMQVPTMKSYFSVAGRLSGFFQYANTFALFLLIALIIIATKDRLRADDFLMLPILLFGVVYSGSRTAFVLMLVTVLALVLFKKNNRHRIVLASLVTAAVVSAALYALLTDNFYSIGRFLTISLTESTFVGRLLYFRDALPVILKNPFGLGYLGYSYMQHSFQTGVYSVRYIHNDFLQLLLDIGWIPTLLFVSAIIKSFFKKGVSLRKRLLIFIISAHTCFDFNFQYIAIFMIFILLLDYKDGVIKEICVSKAVIGTLGAIVTVSCLYVGIAQTLFYCKQYDAANRIYPFSTQCEIELLQKQSKDDAVKTADKIIKSNKYVDLAYRIKAREAYSDGDFKTVIENEKKALETAPFNHEIYEEYCYMLINGIYLYDRAGDKYSSDVCRKELAATVEQLKKLPSRQSKLGKMIKDQPNTELSEEIIQYVEAMENKK